MIQTMVVGALQENAYFFIDETTQHGFVIDPGADGEALLAYIKEQGFTIEKILITHGHFDHIGGAMFLKEALNIPIVIHEAGKKYLEDPMWNLSGAYGMPYTVEADEYVKAGDIITLETAPDMTMHVIHVPGHTEDGVAFYCASRGVVFVGDILFKGAVGRSDFPGGNGTLLLQGIKEKLFTLPEDTLVCTGHGGTTTIQYEKVTNPYFNYDI